MISVKKSISLLLALVFVFSCVTVAFANDNEKTDTAPQDTDVITIETETHKNKYRTCSTAKITVTITNDGDLPLYDVNAQAIFDELKPVNKKHNITSKGVDCLQPGDSFVLNYKAIINIDEFDINFFSKLALMFVGFFRGTYFIDSDDNTGKDITVKKESDSVSFGKFKAENLVEVSYKTKEPEIIEPEETEDITEDPFAISSDGELITTTETTTTEITTTEITTTEKYTERTTDYYREPETTKQRPTEPLTTAPKTTEPRTTEAHFDNPTYEERAYGAYIDFIRENSSKIDQCDAADVNGDGLYDLIFENYDGYTAVYTYTDQYGVYELYKISAGKGYNMEVYYSVINQLVVFPAASTGGSSHTIVKFNGMSSYIEDELVYNNGKFESGCFRNGSEITFAEHDSIINSFASKYYNVDGNATQLIHTLEDLI